MKIFLSLTPIDHNRQTNEKFFIKIKINDINQSEFSWATEDDNKIWDKYGNYRYRLCHLIEKREIAFYDMWGVVAFTEKIYKFLFSFLSLLQESEIRVSNLFTFQFPPIFNFNEYHAHISMRITQSSFGGAYIKCTVRCSKRELKNEREKWIKWFFCPTAAASATTIYSTMVMSPLMKITH